MEDHGRFLLRDVLRRRGREEIFSHPVLELRGGCNEFLRMRFFLLITGFRGRFGVLVPVGQAFEHPVNRRPTAQCLVCIDDGGIERVVLQRFVLFLFLIQPVHVQLKASQRWRCMSRASRFCAAGERWALIPRHRGIDHLRGGWSILAVNQSLSGRLFSNHG